MSATEVAATERVEGDEKDLFGKDQLQRFLKREDSVSNISIPFSTTR